MSRGYLDFNRHHVKYINKVELKWLFHFHAASFCFGVRTFLLFRIVPIPAFNEVFPSLETKHFNMLDSKAETKLLMDRNRATCGKDSKLSVCPILHESLEVTAGPQRRWVLVSS